MGDEPRNTGFHGNMLTPPTPYEAGGDLSGETSLLARFESHLQSSRLLPEGAEITLGLSGGLDSMVLLELLLRASQRFDFRIRAAHFDHRMRPGSGDEARWVEKQCRAVGVRVVLGGANPVPRSETQARLQRYRFLHEARTRLGTRWLLTAHQADDQAETVLFRLLRGSGLEGLAGIPARRVPGVVRPLLPFWRAEIAAFAESEGVAFLVDPSNRDPSIPRSWIRTRLIPALEGGELPDLRRDLVRLADLAGRAARRIGARVETATDELISQATDGRVVVALRAFLAYDSGVQAHLLRSIVARVGPRPGRIGTRIALEFIRTGTSGRWIELGGGIVVRREFERLLFERSRARVSDRELVITDRRGGEGKVAIGGAGWRVIWEAGRRHDECRSGVSASFDLSQLRFPLAVRGWRPGDRIALRPGSRKLKKLFNDRRVGRWERARFPLLVDGEGVLWVVGLERGVRARSRVVEGSFSICMHREE